MKDFPKEQTELYELQSSPYERGCSYDISSIYFFVQVKSGACYITGHWGWVQNKNKPTPTLNPLSSIVFDKNIFVFIVIFMTLSFLRLLFYEEEM